jgi:transcription antitermination factor NusG
MEDIEREPLQIVVRLEDVAPDVPGTSLQPGVAVRVIGGTFKGFEGTLVENPFIDERPFTVSVQEA